MRILTLVSGLGANGATRYALDTSRRLTQRGHQVTVAVRPDNWCEDEVKRLGLDHVIAELRRRPSEFRRINDLIKDRRIDVIYTHCSRAHYFGVLHRLLCRHTAVVATAHNCHLQPHWAFNDRVIAVSDSVARHHRLINLVPKRKLHTIRNWVDASRFVPLDEDEKRAVRRELGISEQGVLVGTLGSYIPRKGFLQLVEAMHIVRQDCPTAQLLIVGPQLDSEYGRRVRDAAASGIDPGAFHLQGPRDDTPRIIGTMDVYVNASTFEGLALTILEAMSAGRPIVATRVGGAEEAVIDGECGRIVRPKRPAALAEAIGELVDSSAEREAMGMAARQRVVEHFSPDTQIPRVEAVLEEAIALHRRKK